MKRLLCIHTEPNPMILTPFGSVSISFLGDFKKHLQEKWPELEIHWTELTDEEFLIAVKEGYLGHG